jgi:hypothetical protein
VQDRLDQDERGNTALFETLMNVIHRTAPDATLSFNTHPGDSVAAVQRWFP